MAAVDRNLSGDMAVWALDGTGTNNYVGTLFGARVRHRNIMVGQKGITDTQRYRKVDSQEWDIDVDYLPETTTGATMDDLFVYHNAGAQLNGILTSAAAGGTTWSGIITPTEFEAGFDPSDNQKVRQSFEGFGALGNVAT